MEIRETFIRLKQEVAKVIIGQERLVEQLLVGILANGHVLVEGVPGLAKTKTLRALSHCMALNLGRVQFTADLLPSDLIGTEIFRPDRLEFMVRKGPVFTNILLADEINRAPSKVQSALLQAMEERQVTIGETTYPLPEPFFVLATQNPIEHEGTYPLPEAQLDRFLMKLRVSYPAFDEERQILSMDTTDEKWTSAVRQVVSSDDLLKARAEVNSIFVDASIERYIVSLVSSSRNEKILGLKGIIEWGASPRASIALKRCGQALAYLRGKDFVGPEEIKTLLADVLRHRIITTFEAESSGTTSDSISELILGAVPVP